MIKVGLENLLIQQNFGGKSKLNQVHDTFCRRSLVPKIGEVTCMDFELCRYHLFESLAGLQNVRHPPDAD